MVRYPTLGTCAAVDVYDRLILWSKRPCARPAMRIYLVRGQRRKAMVLVGTRTSVATSAKSSGVMSTKVLKGVVAKASPLQRKMRAFREADSALEYWLI